MHFKLLVFICLCALFSQSLQAPPTTEGSKLKPNWFKYNGKTYYFVTTYLGNYFKAIQFCRKNGMQLLSINSQEEADKIKEFHKKNNLAAKSYWTSGTSHGGEWMWLSTGDLISYFNWAPNEPNSDGSENCLEIKVNEEFRWNDISCINVKYMICECSDNCPKP